MKKLLILGVIVFATACNSGTSDETSTTSTDSMVNSNSEQNKNDNSMRTLDTTTNLMKDTMNNSTDTTHRP